MTTNDYHFVDCWRVEGDIKEVADILEDALSLPRWWGSVYFEVKEIEPGGEHGIGKLISLRAGGWLPYTLRIDFRTVESRYPYGFSMDATGDLEGKGIWTFEPDGPFVNSYARCLSDQAVRPPASRMTSKIVLVRRNSCG